MSKESALDYLAIGHIAQDLQPDGGYTLGGAVTFAGLAAAALGYRTGVLTSAAASADLSTLAALDLLRVIPSEQSTMFENRYSAAGRTQVLHSRATPIEITHWPNEPAANIVHLAPIADEIDPLWAGDWPGCFVGLTPQGWLRTWDAQGRVTRRDWPQAAEVLGLADAVVLSEEDVSGDWALLARWAGWSRVLVVTRGADGARVFARGEPFDIAAPQVVEVDPTGAGDVFAAVFFCSYARSNDALWAARNAVRAASYWVTQTDLAAIQTISQYVEERE